MNEDAKRRFDSLETLRKAAWDSFDKRRPYEWKMCISLWTTLLAFTGIAVTGRLSPLVNKEIIIIALSVLSIAIFFLHWYWLNGLWQANHFDKIISFFFHDLMMKELSVGFPKEIIEEINKRRNKKGILKNWNHLFQLGITGLLALCAVWATSLLT